MIITGTFLLSRFDGAHRNRLAAKILLALASLIWCGSALAQDDIVYVVFDGNSDAVEKFSAADGSDLGTIGSGGLFVACGIAIDAAGNVYVSNWGNNTIKQFSAAGADLGVFVLASAGLNQPQGLAFDAGGNLYAASSGDNTVRKFSPTGADLGIFASTGLSGPCGVAFDIGGNLYVSNFGDSTVRKFSPTGASLEIFADNGGYTVLNKPAGLAFDQSGNLYVANFDSSRSNIRKFSSTGTDLGQFAGPGSDPDQGLNTPYGIAFDSQGNLFAVNYHHTGGLGTGYSLVLKYSSTGTLLQSVYNTNMRDGSFVAVYHAGGGGGGNQPPTVSLTGPANLATFAAPADITLAATAADSDGTISQVEFYNGETLLGTDTISPYSFTWNGVAAGSYTLTARATDNGGAITVSAVVNIAVNPPGNQPPTVSLTSPANLATFTAPAGITLAATATDSDGTISKVEFFNGATLLGTDTSSPYSFAWNNVAAGSYTLTAKATDNGGTVAFSAAVSITVDQSATASGSTKKKCGFGIGFTALITLALFSLGARQLRR